MKNTEITLKEHPTLLEVQSYIAKVAKQRGFEKESITEKFMLFTEECGELAKAIRKKEKIKLDKTSKEENLQHEIADVFFYLLDICNKLNIDLEEAFLQKEAVNKAREWE